MVIVIEGELLSFDRVNDFLDEGSDSDRTSKEGQDPYYNLRWFSRVIYRSFTFSFTFSV